jgi:hypothetical protein
LGYEERTMIKTAPPSEKTTRTFEALAATLAPRGVSLSAMFGMPCLKREGKAFAGRFGDALVFKLNGEAHAEALALTGAVLFDPSGMGRAMKQWVVVPAGHARKWEGLCAAALDDAGAAQKPSARKAPAKAPKKK